MNRLTQSRKRRSLMKVLVAHGSLSFRASCCDWVAICGRRNVRLVGATSTASETLRVAGLRRPNVIFLGIRLRGVCGLELLLALKRRLPAAIVVMAADRTGTPAKMMKYLAAGADLFIDQQDAQRQVAMILQGLCRRAVEPPLASTPCGQMSEHWNRFTV